MWGRPSNWIPEIDRNLNVRCPLRPGSLNVRVDLCVNACTNYRGQVGNYLLCFLNGAVKRRIMVVFCPARGFRPVALGDCRLCPCYKGQNISKVLCQRSRYAS